ncbi:hypothetical protein DFH07DRAFT_952921 [Mycena maculata]|uniref:BZIP domain-containing protein n=1 Tax=Mycena maculata TaxID=230809 RepID=A0AAD7JVM5_9AGAR|nr:hypothetical protein DFH07DRAFT_952921 [Mycena maculata]
MSATSTQYNMQNSHILPQPEGTLTMHPAGESTPTRAPRKRKVPTGKTQHPTSTSNTERTPVITDPTTPNPPGSQFTSLPAPNAPGPAPAPQPSDASDSQPQSQAPPPKKARRGRPPTSSSEPAGRTLSTSKRAEHNRRAQQAFRARKNQYLKDLESRSELLDGALAAADEANRRYVECHVLLNQLRVENACLHAAQTQLAKAEPLRTLDNDGARSEETEEDNYNCVEF